jgi:mandelate racemase
MTATTTISGVRARPVLLPLARPLRTASGSVPAAPLILIDVTTEDGVVGHSYVFGYTEAALAAMLALVTDIAPALVGKPAVPAQWMRESQDRFRLLGMQGLLGMVVSGIETAIWDALGKVTGQAVVTLLGGEPRPLRAYDSYGLVDPQHDKEALRKSVEDGFRGIKIKVGGSDVAKDVAVVRQVREIIGSDVALMVDYNQSLDPAEACRRIERLREFDLYWVEEPVAAEDLAGHALVRRSAGVPVQSGENWWFPRGFQQAFTAGASDFVMFDVVKIGGVTGWMLAAGQAEAASVRVSSHLFVETSAHVLPVTPTADWLEYLDLASPVLLDPVRPVGGLVTASGPGLGITWNEDAIERYAVR